MKFILLLTVLVAAEAASTAGKCKVGEWSDWATRLPRNDPSGKSFPAPAGGEDVGRVNRAEMMKMKEDAAAERQRCRDDPSCYDFPLIPSEGPAQCIGGVIGGSDGPLCSNVDQQSFVNFQDLGSAAPTSEAGNDIWGWTDPTDGTEYAIMMMASGTAFVRLSDPTAPVLAAFMATETSSSTWRDGKVVNDWAFIVSEATNHGIQAFDLTRLRGEDSGRRMIPNYVIGDVGNCHNIIANPAKNRIYGVGCTNGNHCADRGGLFMMDVSDPASPVGPVCFDGDAYVHDGQCITYTGPDTEHDGKDICFCYNEDTFTIVDMEGAPRQLSRTGYLGSAYTHQGWLTENQEIALLDDELDEQSGSGETRTYMWDVRDLDNPVLRNTYYHGIQSIDHNQYVLGQYTYQANYASGLRIYSINEASYSLTPAGHFDVLPAQDAAVFFGAWSVYPYFASGNIIISSIDFGLYVVRFTPGQTENMTERVRYRTVLSPGDGVCPRLQESEWV